VGRGGAIVEGGDCGRWDCGKGRLWAM